MLALRTITEDNYSECLALQATVDVPDFVDTVMYSLAEAWVFRDVMQPFAIYNDAQLIGFVSMYTGDSHHQIINFLIDDKYQGQGFGTQAAKLCLDFLIHGHHATRISLPVALEHIAAQKFWKRLGFSLSDSVEDGYVFMRYYV